MFIRTGIVLAVVTAALAAAWQPLRESAAVENARIYANDPRLFASQLAIETPRAAAIVRWLPPASRAEVAESLFVMSERTSGDDAARLEGIAHFVSGAFEAAAAAFERIQRPNGRDWSNLAAANISAAKSDEGRWIVALSAVDGATAADPQLPEAMFNRALITEYLGMRMLASGCWRTYAVAGGDARWIAVARTPPVPTDRDAWHSATKDLDALTPRALAQLARQFPEQARSAAEGVFPAQWANAAMPHEADVHLARARVVANVLRQEFGETMASDAVAAIDRAPESLRVHLRRGHRAYADGRRALAKHDFVTAEAHLRLAQRELAEGRSPMAKTAEGFVAVALINRARPDLASPIVENLLASKQVGAYKGLTARMQLERSLHEAERGHWSASLAAAMASAAGFREIRERGNAAAAEAIISEDFYFLGKPELALRHGVIALRDSSAAGTSRPRPILAALTRREMRAARWERAEALSRLDARLSTLARDERLDAGMFLRKAVIEHRLDRPAVAQAAIAAARDAADCLPDADIRAKLIADIDGAAGTIVRTRDPRRGVALLTSAIDYQHRARRPIVLPELYLQRGRAQLALANLNAAAGDFDLGIAELERQRTHVREAEFRAGLFDDAAELFEEAIALQLRRDDDAALVLAYIERGRARALLEQVGSGVQKPARLAEIQRHLGTPDALVEYVSLPDRTVIVLIARNRAVVRTVNASRTMLRDVTNDGARLYDVLIRPIAAELRGIEAVTFVPDDALQRVAFGALFDRVSRTFLIQRHVIATAPSAGLFVFNSQRVVPDTAPSSALVIANPAIPRDAFPDLLSLATSEHEAARVARSYSRAEVIKRDAATAERFLTLAPEFEVVHFAGHAVVQHAEPGASALVCASSPRMHGALTLRQIAGMRFPKTRVVVLAACSTMRGRNAAIEGVPSLARAFVVAGVPAVIGTLWDIDDAAAAPLMRVLHEELAKGTAPADALRAAQLAAIAGDRPVEQWAAFAVTGIAR